MSSRRDIEIIEEIKKKKGIDRALAENTALLSSNRIAISAANLQSAQAITRREINEEIIKRLRKHRP